ncbi:MAG TPA: CopG family antitoxin [Anaerolineae bacterium]|jgi:predicted DNA binding CopG/RHH family protein
MPKLPEFKSDEEAATWFDQHNTTPYIDELEEADETFIVVRTRFVTKPVDVRLRADYLAAIQELAERKGVPYQSLVQTWLVEKLTQEAPDLLPNNSPA